MSCCSTLHGLDLLVYTPQDTHTCQTSAAQSNHASVVDDFAQNPFTRLCTCSILLLHHVCALSVGVTMSSVAARQTQLVVLLCPHCTTILFFWQLPSCQSSVDRLLSKVAVRALRVMRQMLDEPGPAYDYMRRVSTAECRVIAVSNRVCRRRAGRSRLSRSVFIFCGVQVGPIRILCDHLSNTAHHCARRREVLTCRQPCRHHIRIHT